ncbi:ORF6N domain-containing protein [Sulfurovum sp.]|uniref:ORF6N domain-containing protein n=1 Tax=Sulfurovum sp. TaxID=1969726 RepID=UPI0025D024A9|nr:ORF6N domain-containing protein [Sulfurovum sp.]
MNELTIPIHHKIYTLHGKQIMLDEDLASLYEVKTKVFNQAVKRNNERFPDDFIFQLTGEEYGSLRSQFVTLENIDSRSVVFS